MKKIIVIGCPGSGKSTFARALAERTGLPLFHLDMLFWNADKTTVEKSVFLERLLGVVEKDSWIIDGNYSNTLALRLEACDTVFFLDFETAVCLGGVKARRGKPRSDMPWIETEEDAEFTAYIASFCKEKRPLLLRLLAEHPEKRLFVFKSREEADAFLADLTEI